MDFSTRLKELRKSRKETQVYIAQKVNIAERQYQRLEASVSKPTFDNLVALANYFDVSLDYLVGRTDNPKVNK